jgi:polar amino acid transport system permease protein
MPAPNRTPFAGARFGRSAFDIFNFLLLLAILGWLLVLASSRMGYNWQWYRVSRYLFEFTEEGFTAGPLLQGLWITLEIMAVSLVLSMIIGLTACLLRLSGSFMGRALARGYLELVRNTPLLIQIFFIYFVLGPIVGLPRFWAGVLALSLFEGAYTSEIMRAGILSLPRGQWEAAYSLGLSGRATYMRVILPQALRRIVPPLTSQSIALVKDSALVSTISIYELTLQGQVIVANTFLTFEVWFTVAAIYLVLTTGLSLLVDILERHLRLEDAT